MSLDRKIRAILARIDAGHGGEAVAALAALQRLLPKSVSLADVLHIGLHHLRQDIIDPSLLLENRRLAEQLAQVEQAARQHGAPSPRLIAMDKECRSLLVELKEIRALLERI